LDLDGSDTAPADVKFIADETQSEVVALRKDPLQSPAIYVIADSTFEMQGDIVNSAGVRRAAEVPVGILYIAQDYDTFKGKRDTFYVLRAIILSLRDLMDGDPANRTRNGICIEAMNDITELLVQESVGSQAVTGMVILSLRLRDATP
jgi:hypothetical protein